MNEFSVLSFQYKQVVFIENSKLKTALYLKTENSKLKTVLQLKTAYAYS
jgi:hypothetical protein